MRGMGFVSCISVDDFIDLYPSGERRFLRHAGRFLQIESSAAQAFRPACHRTSSVNALFCDAAPVPASCGRVDKAFGLALTDPRGRLATTLRCSLLTNR